MTLLKITIKYIFHIDKLSIFIMNAEIRELVEETVRRRMKKERRLGVGMAIAVFGLLTAFQLATAPGYPGGYRPGVSSSRISHGVGTGADLNPSFQQKRRLLLDESVTDSLSENESGPSVVESTRSASTIQTGINNATVDIGTTDDKEDNSAEKAIEWAMDAAGTEVNFTENLEALQDAIRVGVEYVLNSISSPNDETEEANENDSDKMQEIVGSVANYTLNYFSTMQNETFDEVNVLEMTDEQKLAEIVGAIVSINLNAIKGMQQNVSKGTNDEETVAPAAEIDEEAFVEALEAGIQLSLNAIQSLRTIDEVEAPAPEQETAESGVMIDGTKTPEILCECPPGPPGESAPEFLKEVFSWDENKKVLTINAGTVEFGGSIVVRGYAGVENSIYVGGDPTNGEPSTELAPGSLLLYGPEGGEIAGFSVKENGYEVSNVTLLGELYENDPEIAEPRRVSTRIFG